MYKSIEYLNIPLPEDVQKLKMYGDYAGALKLIDYLLGLEKTSMAMKERLLLEKDILNIMGDSEYPYSFEEAAVIMRDNIRDFCEEELVYLKEISAADWIYINGEVRFQRLFFDNLLKTRPDYAERAIYPDEEAEKEKKQNLLNKNVDAMKKNGGRTVKIRLKTSIRPKPEFARVGEKVRVHLPIPKACKQVSDFRLLSSSHEIKYIAPEDALQRTVYMETELKADDKFEIEYEYINHVDYVALDPDQASKAQPTFYTEEQAPHIVFTPYLKMLLEEILEGETNPIKKARKIYDYVTTHVMYSFMREYFCIENISEYAAVNLKGDCGVQALLFITLCRMAGIPARWQSGLYVTEAYTGSHDWAQFYVAPYGWVFADLSFGGSAYRAGETERWNYYFGNLDVFRMPANSEIQAEFMPPKKWLRGDEIDNQIGEIEYEDCGLLRCQMEECEELLEMTEL